MAKSAYARDLKSLELKFISVQVRLLRPLKLSSEYKASLNMLPCTNRFNVDRTSTKLGQRRLEVWCMWKAHYHEMIEGFGSSPIGFEQKENLLKMEDEKKQCQASDNECNKSR